jgi:hypothetical protein
MTGKIREIQLSPSRANVSITVMNKNTAHTPHQYHLSTRDGLSRTASLSFFVSSVFISIISGRILLSGAPTLQQNTFIFKSEKLPRAFLSKNARGDLID